MTYEQYIKKLIARNKNNTNITINTVVCRNIVLQNILYGLNKNFYYTRMINKTWRSDMPFNTKIKIIENLYRENSKFLFINHNKNILPSETFTIFVNLLFAKKNLGYFNNPHLKTDMYL